METQHSDEFDEKREAVRARRVRRLTVRVWKRRLVNLFIVWHLFAVTLWLLPGNSSLVRTYLEPSGGPVRSYMTATNFNQSWNMFSPNPDQTDVYIEAKITWANGSVRSFVFPRMVNMGFAERYRRERWRKLIEVCRGSSTSLLWPGLAHYAARERDTDPRNRPVLVELIQHARVIPPPGRPMPEFETVTLVVQPILLGDLR